MGKLLDLAFYNPSLLQDESFLAGFVARQDLAAKILARLGEVTPRGIAQHRLIVGQRGMGKTSMLRRIALGVRAQPELAAVLLPLTFREEQYNVHNLHVFWCNCLDALGDWFEASGQEDKAERVDCDVADLGRRDDDDDEGSEALGVFRGWMEAEGRRPLLMLDNIDIILAGLKDEGWSLRRILQERGGIVVIGASAGPLEAAAKQDAPFYDFFQVDVLEKLRYEEVVSCLRRLAGERQEAGRSVIETLDRDRARVRVLYDLTGGNPRTLAMLYLILEARGDGDVMRDLEGLLDQATPLYKARVEELPPQARVVFDAVALAWDPVTAAEASAASVLEVGTVSAQLDRLVKDGVVEKATLSTTTKTAFQVGERFFNIWYLMRHGPRRQRTRLRWLTEVLRRIYSPQELHEYAAALLERPEGGQLADVSYCLALSEAVEDRELAEALRRRYELENLPASAGDAAAWVLAQPHELEALLHKAIEREPNRAFLWVALASSLATQPGRHEEAEASYRKAIELGPKFAAPWNDLGVLLGGPLGRSEEAEAAYRRAIELDAKDAVPWNNLGILLAGPLGRLEEAEAAYRRAIELDPKYTSPWNGLGNLLASQLDRSKEAEAAYRRAIELAPKRAVAWHNLGILLAGQLGLPEEAEAAYRRAIELDPTYASPWNSLGILLKGPLGRPEEAEAAYRRAIELDPKGAFPWNNLALALKGPLGRPEEAEAAYRRAIELDPKFASPWNGLGNLLAGPLSRPGEAEAAYRYAIELDPENFLPPENLAYLLLSVEGRQVEAEQLYQAAVGRLPLHGAGLLRAFHAIAHDNFGAAVIEFGQALDTAHPELFTQFRDDLLRVLTLAAEKGYADKFLEWFDSSSLGDRYWPLRVAFDAYVHGEARLIDVNPEVRSGAQVLLTEMNGLRRRKAPDSAPTPAGSSKAGRPSKSSRNPRKSPKARKRS
jgi:Flp pilus assembly protein TadD